MSVISFSWIDGADANCGVKEQMSLVSVGAAEQAKRAFGLRRGATG